MQTVTATAARPFPPVMLAPREPRSLTQHADAAVGGPRRSFSKGEELYAEGESAEFFYKVVSGTVRVCKVLSDGRRQIEAFHLAGDIFGLENGGEHRFTAEAVDDVVAIPYRSGRLDRLAHDNPELSGQLMSSMLASLGRAHDHMVLLGRKSAREKVASFLLDLASRIADDDRFDLPMQRADIADHLGLTIETVSRTLTQMARDGLIRLATCGRSIHLSDRTRLEALEAA
ncbi:MAG: helix-turn-helix domain-containing protein [Alphaproteobacteria bacterium]|nr:helix-turn-helix domain-containing protein [Alphaproteobacteria bacterium]MCW5740479.1 helix-turn-helix domain-containing protein [Alphaproteobacteria bacterium]